MSAGKGTVVYKNGDKYEGDWNTGLRHGLGTLWIFKEGKYIVRYNGEWRNDAPTVRMYEKQRLQPECGPPQCTKP
jgi:hypothetical protein